MFRVTISAHLIGSYVTHETIIRLRHEEPVDMGILENFSCVENYCKGLVFVKRKTQVNLLI